MTLNEKHVRELLHRRTRRSPIRKGESMTPETARYWLGDGTRPPLIPPYIAQQALETIAAMDYQEADYRPPRFYTLDETTEKGPNLGDHVTRAKRLVGPWEKA